MIRHRQTRFGYPDGNCFATGLASMLSLSEVPDLPGGDDWWSAVVRWCESRKLKPLWFEHSLEFACWLAEEYENLYLVSGESPRGLLHVVVGYRGDLVHDPHPSDEFIVGEPEGYFLVVPQEAVA